MFSAEPPSYDSLFGRIRDTHKASRNVIDFLVKETPHYISMAGLGSLGLLGLSRLGLVFLGFILVEFIGRGRDVKNTNHYLQIISITNDFFSVAKILNL